MQTYPLYEHVLFSTQQAIKQLRKEVVEAMRTLMRLAKEKQTNGMLPICEDMIRKTRILLSLWDPGLVEEALNFIEEYKLVMNDESELTIDDLNSENCHKSNIALSPFKRITQQLTSLNLKSPDLDDFATPCTPMNVEDIWNLTSQGRNTSEPHLLNTSEGVKSLCSDIQSPDDRNFVLFPDCDDSHNEVRIISSLIHTPLACCKNNFTSMSFFKFLLISESDELYFLFIFR